MKRLLAGLLALMILAGCSGGEAGSSASSSESSAPVSSESSRIGLAGGSASSQAVELTRDESFYTEHAIGVDAAFLPLFSDPANLSEWEKYQFFNYFICAEGLYGSGEDFLMDSETYKIPVSEIQTVLERHLGVSFDPAAAFADRLYDGQTYYGYDAAEGVYYEGMLGAWVTEEFTAVLAGREDLGDGKLELRFGCYYIPGEMQQYKTKTMVFQENPEDPDGWKLLANIDTYPVDGQDVVVHNADELDQLRPYIMFEDWYR